MKIAGKMVTFHRTKWGGKSFSTPYIKAIINESSPSTKGHLQLSFVIGNYHFWAIVK
jgi:hypothetical protein